MTIDPETPFLEPAPSLVVTWMPLARFADDSWLAAMLAT